MLGGFVGVFRTKKSCSPTSNAECECVPGFHCLGAGCAMCEEDCKRGQEPTKEGRCGRLQSSTGLLTRHMSSARSWPFEYKITCSFVAPSSTKPCTAESHIWYLPSIFQSVEIIWNHDTCYSPGPCIFILSIHTDATLCTIRKTLQSCWGFVSRMVEPSV